MSYDFHPTQSEDAQPLMQRLRDALSSSRRVVGVIGAGASASCGIQTFRGPGSTTYRSNDLRTIMSEGIYRDGKLLSRHYDFIRDLCLRSSSTDPSPFHRLFNQLAEQGRLLHLFTQNIDGLEDRLPYLYTDRPLRNNVDTIPNFSELHGNVNWEYCVNCRQLTKIRLHHFIGEQPPACPACEEEIERAARENNKRSNRTPGVLRPWILLYNDEQENGLQSSELDELQARVEERRPDMLIVGGTSLSLDVVGARKTVQAISSIVREEGGLTVWINKEVPRQDCRPFFDIIVQGTCDQFATGVGL